MEKRNNVIDIVKGIGIIFVIFSHLTFSGQIQRNIIHSFNMPLFFIISGFLYKEKKTKEVFKKGIKKYVFPVLVFVIIDIIKILIKVFYFNEERELFEIIKTILCLGGYMLNPPIWFLLSIFNIIIIFNFFKRWNVINYIFAIIAVIYCTFFNQFEFNGFLWPICILSGYPFFVLGNFLKERINLKVYLEKYINSNIGILIQLIMFVFFSYYNGYCSMIELDYGRSYIIFIVTGCIGTNLVVYISNLIEKLKVNIEIGIVGKYSIWILLTHYIICRKIIPCICRIINLQDIQYNIIFQVLVTVIISLLYWFIFKIYENKKRRLYKYE